MAGVSRIVADSTACGWGCRSRAGTARLPTAASINGAVSSPSPNPNPTTMIPGIDPKIDIAFKKVFGSEPSRDLTASLINAVLEPPPRATGGC